ncbi:hypothetical protein LCGC14_2173460 [marine sediment metagenome]|uniref:Methyltransferase domain-containing protein n=1 Tax=marine sediment metagenome TaxID=412755 RepID=A0A0F9GK75_9ZZZZ
MDKMEFERWWNTCAHNDFDGNGRETYGWWAQQDERELWWLMEKALNINAKKIVEIGAAHGGTLFFWDKVAGEGGTTMSVDFNPNHGITLDLEKDAESTILLLHADSHDPETLNTVKEELGSIDLLFIDADHTYEGAKQDYEMYSPLVRPGGLVGFHDVIYDTEIQVRRFFKEIDEPKETIELLHGIGVVYK